MIPTVRRAMTELNANIPTFSEAPVTDLVERRLRRERLLSSLLTVFAGVTVFICCLGIYGMLAYAVERRRQEISVRMAIGAQTSDVIRLMVRESLVPVASGLLAGALLSIAGQPVAGAAAVRRLELRPADARRRERSVPAGGGGGGRAAVASGGAGQSGAGAASVVIDQKQLRVASRQESLPRQESFPQKDHLPARITVPGKDQRFIRPSSWRPSPWRLDRFAAVLRLSRPSARPNFLVKRSTRPSVSISFWRPVKNGWHSSRCPGAAPCPCFGSSTLRHMRSGRQLPCTRGEYSASWSVSFRRIRRQAFDLAKRAW